MKYKLFTFLFCFLVSLSLAQKKVVFTSNGFILIVRNDEVEKNSLRSSANANKVFIDESRPGQIALSQANIIVAIPQNSKPRISIISYRKSFVENYKAFFNPITVQVNDSTLKTEEVSVPKPLMGEPEPMEVLGYFQLRDFYCVALKINKHLYDYSTQKCFLLDSLQIKFEFPEGINFDTNNSPNNYSYFDSTLKHIIWNWQQASEFRINKSYLLPQNDSWINYSSNYLRLAVTFDKLYRLNRTDLERFGVNTENINPKTFQIFESGKEVPIYVAGEKDLKFDANDYIEFWGTKNYSKISPRIINKNEEEYHEFMNRITDSTYYFLTWANKTGKRIDFQQQTNPDIADTLRYYDEFSHLEDHPIDVLFYTFSESLVRNQFPFWESSKSWYWKWLASWSSVVGINFSALNTILDRSSRVYAKVCSRGSNQMIKPHYISLNINSKIVDSTYLDRYGRVLLGGKDGRWIKEGNNLIELKYKENNGSTSGACVLDWLEIEYPKKLELQNDSLSFAYRAELPLKERWIKIEKAGDQTYAVYRVKPAYRKITDYKIEKGSLYFRDSVGTGYEYAVCSEAKITTPFQIEIKKFANIRDQIKGADYIAISHSKFRQAVNKYVANIASSMNLRTAAYFVNDIYDEFGFGYPTPESIKEFIKYLLANSPKPLPSYLTLIGDANYDYKGVRKKQAGVRVGENYVPSYGFPVSDPWYVIMDSINIALPQMYVGRIPINNESELDYYWSKVSENSTTRFDNWNKKFLFFSGGSGTQNELDVLKNVQQQVIDKYIKPVPLSGQSDHFYKITGNDFGPYSNEYVNKAIDEGAVFVSYLGHSGTATWDNSISDVSQLKSSRQRNYFVSDFGCSTNKFAEPDITCFGERFLLSSNGQALGYIGNSSLGFTSIAYAAPNLLFESFVKDKKNSIGEIHWLTKAKLFSQLGNSESARLFNYTNTLLGDPAIELQVPTKPNLFINERNISLNDENIILDSQDSVSCKINFYNYGTSETRNFSYKLTHIYNQKSIDVKESGKMLPNFTDSVVTKLFVKDLPGIHSLRIQLDNKNEISEIYDDDNEVTLTFYVSANQVRDQLLSINSNGNINVLNVLSPQQKPVGDYRIVLKTGTDPNFEGFELKEINPEKFYTKVGLPQSSSLRHWFKFGFITNDTTWTKEKSYLPGNTSKISFNDLYSFAGLKSSDILFSDSGIGFKKDTMRIGVISAGQFAGQTCIISLNGKNLLANSFFMGIGICTFNPVTYELESSNWYDLFNQPANHNAFESFVKSIPNGKIVALGISGDAVNNNSTQFKNVLKSIGSTKADSIQYKGSWAFIGIKGGDPKTFIEVVKGPFAGLISIKKDLELTNSSGDLTTELIGPVNTWNSISISAEGNQQLNFILTPIGYKNVDEKGDTLAAIVPINNKAELLSLKYPFAKFIVKMNDNSKTGSGLLKRIDLDYIGVPELGTNYQVVSISKDSLEQGEKASLNFSVYNVGESTASNFKVRVDLVKKDNSKEKLFEQVIDSIQTEKKKDFSLSYTTDKLTGSHQFQITIDTENAITELYKDNNFYSVPFYVKPNDKPASLKLTIDGNDIINGDFISPKPNFKIELNDESLIPIADTSKVLLYMNNKRIYFASNTGILDYSYSSSNPKMIVNYTPTLADGDYTLKVIGKNATDQIIDSIGIVRKFTVKNELQLLNAYNYPNPFKDDTYFTFKLTQIPDELKIIIYTIAGRKIKEIKLNSTELKYDFNRIFWDGRDQDGDLTANGVYLYKIISQKGSEKTELTQKLAILR